MRAYDLPTFEKGLHRQVGACTKRTDRHRLGDIHDAFQRLQVQRGPTG